MKRWAMWVAVRWAALFIARRRGEWHRDLPILLPLTVLFLPILIPLVGYLHYLLLEHLVQAFCRVP